MSYINVYVENEKFVVFKHHFETGKLKNTKLGQFVNNNLHGGSHDNRINYNKQNGNENLYLDCSIQTFRNILDYLYDSDENDMQYFVSPLTNQDGGNFQDQNNYSLTEENDIENLEAMFENIDTVSTPILNSNENINTNVLLGGNKTEIDTLVNNIHDKLNGKDRFEIIQLLSNDKNIKRLIEESKIDYTESEPQSLYLNTDTINTDTNISESSISSIRTKYIDIN